MPESPLIAAGAQVEPISAAPLHTNEWFTGMWTQGNPLGSGAVPFLYQKFYSAMRYDRLVGGKNIEITSRLSLARRPGNLIYNLNNFPPINRFYEFRAFQGGQENIHILADVGGTSLAPTSLVVASVLVTKQRFGLRDPWEYTLSITFTSNVPAVQPGQTYTFSGLTGYTALNGTTQINGSISSPNTVSFSLGLTGLEYGPIADTGKAIVTLAVPSGGTVRDVTGPATDLTLWTKDSAAGRTSFQSVGNIVFFSDGVNASKWVQSANQWIASTAYPEDSFFVDPNNNIQRAIGAQTAKIVNIQIVFGSGNSLATLFFSPNTQLKVPPSAAITLTGLTSVPSLNGSAYGIASIQNGSQITLSVPTMAPIAFTTETGTATTGTGITGTAQPVWGTALNDLTFDGGAQWQNLGPSVELWGIQTPTIAPTVTQTPAPSIYSAWAANTWYAPLFVILVGGVLYQLTTAGITGGASPSFNPTPGATTADGTAIWKSLGFSAWIATKVYAAGAVIQASFSYWITVSQMEYLPTGYPPPAPPYAWQNVPVQQLVTATGVFVCIGAGTSGSLAPSFSGGLGTTTADGTVIWQNMGTGSGWPGSTQTLNLATKILDSNSNIQTVQTIGMTGAGPVIWATDEGSFTTDGTTSWLNGGSFGAANTAAWQWAYSGKNSITGHIGTASPLSLPMMPGKAQLPVIQGVGLSGDPQIDTLVIWRTLQGGSTLLYLDQIPNPRVGTWIYTDTTPDSGLNELITAPIASSNNPPPAGFKPMAYYLNRIWGFVGNRLVYSGGPTIVTGSGDESFAPLNSFALPSLGVTCWPTSIGLIVYTNSDVWVLLGQGTSSSPFYLINFQAGIGLAGQDALTINGSTAYGMLTSGQVVSMDPGAGELEVGFPIGDQFDSLYTGSESYLAYHPGSSADAALYVADGSTGWFRMAAVAAPESGNVWSPRALIAGGVKAIASLEIAPGVKRLLLGPSVNGPILMRDKSVSTDNEIPYEASAEIGSIVMAQPGTTVGVQFITTEEMMIVGSSRVSIGILLDEIAGSYDDLTKVSNDPPNQPRSTTIEVNRFWAMQNAQPVTCRHMRVEISWKAEAYPNELYTYTIYGRLPTKARK